MFLNGFLPVYRNLACCVMFRSQFLDVKFYLTQKKKRIDPPVRKPIKNWNSVRFETKQTNKKFNP